MNRAERSYYHQRAPEYDDWYLGAGQYAERVRPGWHAELGSLRATLAGLPACRTLDVACGTGFLTRDLAGERLPGAGLVQGDAFSLPFRDASFARLVAAHFYGHLEAPARARFWAETRRVASSLLVVDAAWRADVQPEEWQPRILRDGSRHTVYKRYFTPAQLAAEAGGGRILHSGRWFVAVLG